MPENSSGSLWIVYTALTMVCWGLYGILLHTGQLGMADPDQGRNKAFFWVGIAYFIIAIVGPAILLLANGSSWSMPSKGIIWSLIAGAAGAVGAFGVLLAFGARGHPAVVMSLIFAGAPVVNALVVIAKSGAWSRTSLPFWLGVVLAAAGGFLVTVYKPAPPHGGAPTTTTDKG